MAHEENFEPINQDQAVSPDHLAQLIEQVAAAPFARELLEVDAALWGGFWHFDVIGPGYRLPAAELALLRAIRLDQNWPEETDLAQFLASLQQAISDPQAGIWRVKLAGAPCLIIAAETHQPAEVLMTSVVYQPVTVVWYCATTGQLHAGYRATPGALYFPAAIEQRAPQFEYKTIGKRTPPPWIEQTLENKQPGPEEPLAVRLDRDILRLRGESGGDDEM